MKKKGFTLIELLVVISIIAILAAIIMPVYSRIREQGRQTQCISNLHFIGQAMVLYRDDQKAYPYFDYTAGGPGLQALIQLEYLEKVQGTDKALICPDNGQEADSYDTFRDPVDGTNKVVYNWGGYGADPAAWTGYSADNNQLADTTDGKLRFLANRNCPGDTIITHCAYHRTFYGTNKGAWQDIILFVNGSTEKARSTQAFKGL